uniref:Uncharacterized protein n=1 Tax=Arundo donax TaxID=35708 RepID=A0A0A8Y6F0_ARUDO
MPTTPAPTNDINDENSTILGSKISTSMDGSRFPSHLKTVAPTRQKPKVKCQYIT